MPSAFVSRAEDVVRHASGLYVHGDKVDGFAMLPRSVDTDGASVHRLIVFSDDAEAAMRDVRSRSRLSLKDSHRFIQVNVGELIDCFAATAEVGVVEDPLVASGGFPPDPSHALVTGLPRRGIMDDYYGDLIRRRIKAVHRAVA